MGVQLCRWKVKVPCAVDVNFGGGGRLIGGLRDCMWKGKVKGEKRERLRNRDSGRSPGWMKGPFAEMEARRGLRRDGGLALDV